MIEHGTVNTYARHRCRCDACKAAQAAYKRSYRGRSQARHGTTTRYVYGPCRCDECVAAVAAKFRDYRGRSTARHGTTTRYEFGACRCEKCRRAKARAMKAWLRRRRRNTAVVGRRGRPPLPRPFALEPLLERYDGNTQALARTAGVHARQVFRWKYSGLTVEQADELAVKLGLHPVEVWPHFYDAAA